MCEHLTSPSPSPQVDFLAGDQSVMAVRFEHGALQLRFGDDFGLSLFKRELRRLLPSGIDHWRRAFGYHVDASAAADGAEESEGEGGADEEEGAAAGVQDDDDEHDAAEEDAEDEA